MDLEQHPSYMHWTAMIVEGWQADYPLLLVGLFLVAVVPETPLALHQLLLALYLSCLVYIHPFLLYS